MHLDRYLIRHIFTLGGVVALGLMTIYTFTTFVTDLDNVGEGDFGVAELTMYTLLNAPAGLETLLPIIAMLGTLMGLGHLAAQNELIAMRAAGISPLRIGLATLLGGLLLGLAGWLLGDLVSPWGRQTAEQLRSEARYGHDAGAVLRPVWLREGPHVVRVGRLVNERHVENVTIYTLGENRSLEAVTTIGAARFDGSRWQIETVERTAFAADRIDISREARTQWTGALSPDVLRLFVLEAHSLSARGLLRLIDYLQLNGLDSSAQRLDLWKKMIAPLTVMAMMLFAVPFAFGSLRSSGAGQRLLLGVVIGVCFYVVDEVTASLGLLYGWPPPLAAGLPTAVLAVIGWARLVRAR